MRSMKILHTADIHLAPRLEYIEDAGRRAQRREDVAAQADAIPRLAREHGVDAVVIAGDAFDRDLPAQAEVARLARALADAAVPVLVAPGTHDPWRPGGVWDRDWPVNVTIFRRDEWETVRVGETAFHGIATTGRPRALFDGLPTDPDARFQVGVAHASMLWADVKEKVDRKNYPFEEADLDATALNYLALGDHHRMRVARRGVRAAAYPGSPEGIALDPAEAGDRFMLVVTLTDPASPPTIEPVKVDRREVYLEGLEMRGFRSYAEPIEVRFDGGLNVFMGRNEAGKTGLLRAIQCALFPPSRGTDRHSLLAEGEGECRLALEYRLPGGERWRVERDLTAYKHALHAWRDNSWEPVSTALSDIADVVRAHTGCDEALFERTLLVRHEAVEVPASADVTKTLAARLELVAGGSGRVSAVAAAAKLEAGFKKLSGPYKGEIVVAAERLREALGGLDRAQALAGRLVETRARLEKTAEALTRLALEQTDAAAVLKRARDVAAAERELADAQEKRAMLDQALTVAAPSVPAWAWPAIAAGAL